MLKAESDGRTAATRFRQEHRLGVQPLGDLVAIIEPGERAAGGQHIPDKATMHNTYQRLRGLDDGLPPIDATNLLSSALWP